MSGYRLGAEYDLLGRDKYFEIILQRMDFLQRQLQGKSRLEIDHNSYLLLNSNELADLWLIWDILARGEEQ